MCWERALSAKSGGRTPKRPSWPQSKSFGSWCDLSLLEQKPTVMSLCCTEHGQTATGSAGAAGGLVESSIGWAPQPLHTTWLLSVFKLETSLKLVTCLALVVFCLVLLFVLSAGNGKSGGATQHHFDPI